MLLSTEFAVEKTLVLNFFYEDGTENRTVRFGVGDLIDVTYNAGQRRINIRGTVTRIEAGNHMINYPISVVQEHISDTCDKTHWYIIVDGSAFGRSRVERIEVCRILDVENITGGDTVNNVTSPLGAHFISNLRLCGNLFQASTDGGKTWITVSKVPEIDANIEPELKDLADKLADILPECMNPATKAKFLEELVKILKETGNITVEGNPVLTDELIQDVLDRLKEKEDFVDSQLNELIKDYIEESVKEQFASSSTTGETSTPGGSSTGSGQSGSTDKDNESEDAVDGEMTEDEARDLVNDIFG